MMKKPVDSQEEKLNLGGAGGIVRLRDV